MSGVFYKFNRSWSVSYIRNDELSSAFLQRISTLILRTYDYRVLAFKRERRKNRYCFHVFTFFLILKFVVYNFT